MFPNRYGKKSRIQLIEPQPLILATGTLGYKFETATKQMTRIGDQILISNRLNDFNSFYSQVRKGAPL